ncbi:hypothetical protein DS2_06176 [Catenovulum agarivorans DS-2]|uniref:Uncharacterized protein n=1 Tax=Catenovulum agarivorans DS-2 TaxID=1328313 RepID=W7QZS9_9ALTE|nr:hypothetical protein [Catenovulum agarivorans]EWH10855.1 hypothetical protein DS2_06176 [Catenovulum agarivorans DS-2]
MLNVLAKEKSNLTAAKAKYQAALLANKVAVDRAITQAKSSASSPKGCLVLFSAGFVIGAIERRTSSAYLRKLAVLFKTLPV